MGTIIAIITDDTISLFIGTTISCAETALLKDFISGQVLRIYFMKQRDSFLNLLTYLVLDVTGKKQKNIFSAKHLFWRPPSLVAQWILLHLLSCSPGFESRAQNLCYLIYNYIVIWKERKETGIDHIWIKLLIWFTMMAEFHRVLIGMDLEAGKTT